MADQKISELTAITGANTADDDLLVIVDTSTGETKKITLGELEAGIARGDMTFGDNQKAIFGAGSDLQIYHDGSNSRIVDTGTGDLSIEGANVRFRSTNGDYYAYFTSNAESTLYYNNAAKLATTSTGIDVTGTATMDGLTVYTGSASGTVASFKGSSGFGFTLSSDATSPYVQTIGVGGGEEVAITSGGTKLALFQDGGDISFYEDTGTTAKFFWDASAESLTVPVLYLNDGLVTSGQAGSASVFNEDGTTADFRVESTGNTHMLFVDGGLNRVGIGTSSPSGILHLSANNPDLYITSADTGQSDILMGGISDPDAGIIRYADNDDSMRIFTNNTERMRIDSSGNLLVAQSTSVSPGVTNTITGHSLSNVGYATHSRSNGVALHLNRNTSDGDIAVFRKDGTTVGSIGNIGSRLYIGTGDTGIYFNDGLDQIYPVNTNGTNRDAAVTLGTGSVRFKDLYLSGGVYLGGTGAANKLDDYETGTFTPTIIGDSTAGAGTYTRQLGNYRKVGDLVYVQIRLSWTAHTGTGNMRVSGLPFTQLSTAGTEASAAIGLSTITKTSGYQLLGAGNPNTTQIVLYQNSSTGGSTVGVTLDTAADLIISMVYSV